MDVGRLGVALQAWTDCASSQMREVDSWLEREIASCRFDDVRHGKRLGVLLEQLSERIGGSIPFACQDWAATKAAHRFFPMLRRPLKQ
jgi:hypothetical protein